MQINKNKKIAIITGASSGFGVEFSKRIDSLREIEEIWLIARREQKLLNTSKQLKNAKSLVIVSDLSSKEGISKIKKLLEKEKPEVKFLINNAGFGKTEKFEYSDDDYNEKMIDVNVKAQVMVTKLVLPYMSEGSYIANVASSAAYAPLPYFAVYAASKAFILSFSYSLKEELRHKNISVTAVCPGPAGTEFFKSVKGNKVNGLSIRDPKLVIRKAMVDILKRRSVSVYGLDMNLLRIISKLLPRKILAYFSSKVKLPD
ncbi:MAG: SDR family NAD(P)-dependent oxidoreductase [Candidatus Delongbacteria bacterium]|nr:SDR family NAD(P)-dependent oxidoreductase [Candidatus Delongbacteria bacterium]